MIERSNKECPCKLLPRSFSSYTAAEYGDVHSLSKIQDVATRRDDSGYTPLHYAAQFNQVAATAMLLELGCSIDGGGYCGATPLHRASFSGATASMKVLLVWNDDIPCHYPEEEVNNDTGIFTARTSSQLSDRKTCNLLARDSSYGDESTPLHKAAAGGRYLAVHMLLEAMKERDTSNSLRDRHAAISSKVKKSWLQSGLESRDKFGRTPYDVALHFSRIQETERASVARWDAVAGGFADWGKCKQLLQKAATTTGGAISNIIKEPPTTDHCTILNADAPSVVVLQNKKSYLPRLPRHLTKGSYECFDCDASGKIGCSTISWQTAFEKALGDSVCIEIPFISTTSNTVANSSTIATPVCLPIKVEKSGTTINKTIANDNNSSTCPKCKKACVAFYPLIGQGILVCKGCVKKKNKK